jgi:hypothetical protein
MNQVNKKHKVYVSNNTRFVCATNFYKYYTIDRLGAAAVLLDDEGYLCKVLDVSKVYETIDECIFLQLRNNQDVYIDHVLVRG